MNLRGFFTKKKIIWTAIIVLVVGYVGYRVSTGSRGNGTIQTDTVKRQNLQQTVLSTSQVVSSVDLQLSFKSGGVVSRVNVREGDRVKAGQVLATLDQIDQLASLTQAQGALASAQASYDKVLAGAATQDVAVAQAAVNAAKSALENTRLVQAQAVANALSQLVGIPAGAVSAKDNYSTTTLTISGTYQGADMGVYTIKIENGDGPTYSVYGLETVVGVHGSRTTPTPLGTRGLKLLLSSAGTLVSGETWTVEVPNTAASTYSSLAAAYQAAQVTQKQQIDAAQAALDQAQAALALKAAPARQVDIEVAKAQRLTAQGQVAGAEANVEHTIIRAPADGTITQVAVKVGEQATAGSPVLVLQDVSSLHLEAQVSEADIASVQPGQSVDVTFDALGPNRHFTAKVETVNPASTVVSGVVNYKVKAALETVSDVKPGMTANMTILVATKDGALAVPQQAVINQNGHQYVRLIDDLKTKSYHQVEVQTGLQADGGLDEITSGLSEGQTVVIYIKA